MQEFATLCRFIIKLCLNFVEWHYINFYNCNSVGQGAEEIFRAVNP